MILLLVHAALAGDIVVLQPGQTFKATEKSFVLPEPMYDTCLAKAEALQTVQAELKEKGDAIVAADAQARAALDACSTAAANAQQKSLLLEKDLTIVRQQRTFLIVGGVVLTAIVAGETYALVEAAVHQ